MHTPPPDSKNPSPPRLIEDPRRLRPILEASGRRARFFHALHTRIAPGDPLRLVREYNWLRGALVTTASAIIRNFDYTRPSLQNDLLGRLQEKHPGRDVSGDFEAAKDVRWRGALGLAARLLTGADYPMLIRGLWETADSTAVKLILGIFPDARMHIASGGTAANLEAVREIAELRMIAAFPRQLLLTAGHAQVAGAADIVGRGDEFYVRLGSEMGRLANLETLTSPAEVAMVRHFTDPDFPLWLMTKEPLTEVLYHRFGIAEVTEEGAKRMRNRRLKCPSRYPITGVSFFTNGRSVFRFAKWM